MSNGPGAVPRSETCPILKSWWKLFFEVGMGEGMASFGDGVV